MHVLLDHVHIRNVYYHHVDKIFQPCVCDRTGKANVLAAPFHSEILPMAGGIPAPYSAGAGAGSGGERRKRTGAALRGGSPNWQVLYPFQSGLMHGSF